MQEVCYAYQDSPVGKLMLVGQEDRIEGLFFSTEKSRITPRPEWRETTAPFRAVAAQLEAYFGGKLRKFDLRLAPEGTHFQTLVWRALLEIPYGETVSYAELARRIGRPKAVRAVGAANGRNPISIVIPCHRVIGSDGKLTGYGGGLAVKQALLDLERRNEPGSGTQARRSCGDRAPGNVIPFPL